MRSRKGPNLPRTPNELGIRFPKREGAIKQQSKWATHVSASVLVTVFVVALGQFSLDGLNGVLVDALFRTHWKKSPVTSISLVAYDDASSRRFGGSLKIPVEEMIASIEHIKNDQPRAIAVIGSINERDYSDQEIEALAKCFAKTESDYIGFLDDDSLGNPPPIPFQPVVKYRPGYISRDTFSYGADAVTRRVMLTIEGFPSLYADLARMFRGMTKAQNFHATSRQAKGSTTLQTYIHWQGPPGTYPMHSSEEVGQGNFPKGTFTNKIVLIGSALSRKDADFVLTPYSREPHETTYLEGAAHSLGTLINDDGIKRSSYFAGLLFSLLIGIAVVNLALLLSPGRGIVGVLGVIVATVVSAWVGLFAFNTWVDLAHPLIAACVSYYVVIPYRLLSEYRVRWYYQQKTEWMGQLEQLKSNFLSLISHDLKTPISRIQGNAELVLNAPNLSDSQRKSLGAIIHTTEDLSEYVQTVLDLTRIESAELPLQKTSKDINATIAEVVESKKFLAAEKHITLSAQLEPLFSFKFDVTLIRRVLSNLVENAIKYSPPNSEIILSSKEDNGWIRVSVTDRGFGIEAGEQTKVFEKFYRCDNPATRETKGTGLGLYLVKYFVELHRGAVDLKSELGNGSIFTISLPV